MNEEQRQAHNKWLWQLIDEGKIEFYKGDTKLAINVGKCDKQTESAWSEYGASSEDKYVWRLERHLARQAKDYLVVRGSSLDAFLIHEKNVPILADFALGIHVGAESGVKVWVDADINKIAKNYEGKNKGELRNLTRTVRIDTTKWGGRMSVFERDWNIALCAAWGGFVGYPGYEWPRTAKQFEICCAEHATDIMIGTKAQLKRYERYADKFPGCREEIKEALAFFNHHLYKE